MHTSSVASVTSNAVRLLCPWDSPRQEYWSELPFPTSGDLLDPEIELTSFYVSHLGRWVQMVDGKGDSSNVEKHI